MRFSAMMALQPPGRSDFANKISRSRRRRAVERMENRFAGLLIATSLINDLLFCSDY